MSLKLKEVEIKSYKNYYIDISTDINDLIIDWNSNSSYVRIWNNFPKESVFCHIDNLDNLIEGLTLLKGKIKK